MNGGCLCHEVGAGELMRMVSVARAEREHQEYCIISENPQILVVNPVADISDHQTIE